MNDLSLSATTRAYAESNMQHQGVLPEYAMKEEKLPFTVKLVDNDDELQKAVNIRHAAYQRHVPAFAEKLKSPEPIDKEEGVIILLAESKLDGSPIGTMRLQTNIGKPLPLEQSVTLPDWLSGRTLGEATRLGVSGSQAGRLVTAALFKAGLHYCFQTGIEWIVVAGRSPIDRQYERLMFDEVFPGLGYVPLKHANNMPHRIMSIEIGQIEPRWHKANHPLYNFFFRTFHEDIRVNNEFLVRNALEA
ncbi:MAG TPA: hypothetical protein VGU61_08675 [Noviherbaspirillum sp.]|jgi:hypothetical protein|uniref:N-acyl amino acid synthase FeeM domain-containing protein n=1 Tax=Noviherbaspirillum sp. TaxID=1926288 RepID=UPI002DDD668D|nr:hypothetical protein [Noviherbaspirillum sp.]HEV2610326.1 hypothetical protein [Noviherbaspirillum sp.]